MGLSGEYAAAFADDHHAAGLPVPVYQRETARMAPAGDFLSGNAGQQLSLDGLSLYHGQLAKQLGRDDLSRLERGLCRAAGADPVSEDTGRAAVFPSPDADSGSPEHLAADAVLALRRGEQHLSGDCTDRGGLLFHPEPGVEPAASAGGAPEEPAGGSCADLCVL